MLFSVLGKEGLPPYVAKKLSRTARQIAVHPALLAIVASDVRFRFGDSVLRSRKDREGRRLASVCH